MTSSDNLTATRSTAWAHPDLANAYHRIEAAMRDTDSQATKDAFGRLLAAIEATDDVVAEQSA